jgi:hypothetical protein
MSDRVVTIASFAFTPEAEMAKNLLETEGIPAFLAGELSANLLNNAAGEVQLQVRAQDAQRAVAVLAAAEATLDDDWETQTERGVWTCPICGTAVPLDERVCPACHTSNPGITTEDQHGRTALDRWESGADRVQKADPIQEGITPAPLPKAEAEETSSPRALGCVVLFVFPCLWLRWLVQ